MDTTTIHVLFICVFTFCVSISSSLNSDGLSLLALKAAVTGDPTNSLATWTETDFTPCHWTGIACDSNRRVTSVFLPNRNLTGYLPSELDALLSLRHLSSNLLTGNLPETLSNLTNLGGTLNLSYNHFSGAIPPSYGLFR
ncbi:hypothetical protein SSX86_032032 [Deinandra increscens subsp. villosa]|uniref:Leucine-rich repeat-containing N-terminal plant-type domain-containing protein n=1 Tax=Deinandra increscens subsp. villosa TaxID=3103831 RepID=A0AAP0GHP3_9ASTR